MADLAGKLRTAYESSDVSLARVLLGTVLYAAFAQITRLFLGIGEAIQGFISPIIDGLQGGMTLLTTGIRFDAAQAWDPLQAGVFGFAINLAVVLVALYVVARLWSTVGGDG